jgi:hypothetical protein
MSLFVFWLSVVLSLFFCVIGIEDINLDGYAGNLFVVFACFLLILPHTHIHKTHFCTVKYAKTSNLITHTNTQFNR